MRAAFDRGYPVKLEEIDKFADGIAVQDAALGDGEGCLSVDRDVPGYVVRHARVTVEYFNKEGEKQRVKLRGYNSIVVQHEIDHTNGIMFYDRINKDNPFAIKDGLLIIE